MALHFRLFYMIKFLIHIPWVIGINSFPAYYHINWTIVEA